MCSKATDPKNPARRPRSPRSEVCKSSIRIEAIGQSLSVIATRSQVGIQIGPRSLRLVRAKDAHVGFTAMDLEQLPPQVRTLLRALDRAMKSCQPAIRSRVDNLRAANPLYTNHQLARALIRSTRRRVAATGALSGAAAVVPALGTALAIGTVTSQTLYALEQEIELVLGIAMIFGHEPDGSDDRVLEALVVVGMTSGALKLREDVIVA